MTWPPVTTVAVLAVVVVAAFLDVKNRRVPNALTLGAAVVALALHSVLNGWPGLLIAASGWAVGLLLFLPLYAVRGMGAGDVKLLAAIGAWLGPEGALWTALYGAVAGGVLAVVVMLARGYARKAVANIAALLNAWRLGGVRPVDGITLESSTGPRLPYALPLAVGAAIALWVR